MRNSIKLFLIGILLTSCHQKVASDEDSTNGKKDIKDSITSEINEIYKQGYIVGFSVAIVNEKKTLYKNGFGFADLEKKVKYSVNTVQNIASISKTLIGIALLKAQEMGKLHLDDPINMYLPFEVKNPYFPGDPITIRHLATHTSTIIDTDIYTSQSYVLKDKQDNHEVIFQELPQKFNPPEKRITMSVFLEKILSENGQWYLEEGFLYQKPGEQFEYSNIAATLAAVIIEFATGESYNSFTSKYILEPLGMTSSGWSFDELDFSEHSKLYASPGKEIPFYSLITYPDGGFITSISDLSKYLLELIRGYAGNGTLLKKESYGELFSEQLKADNFTERDEQHPYNDEYNSGIFMGFSAKGYIGHSGGDPGVASYMFFDSINKVGRILIVNTSLNGQGGSQEFFAVWDKLEEYQTRLARFSS